jgi:hypothetical protein
MQKFGRSAFSTTVQPFAAPRPAPEVNLSRIRAIPTKPAEGGPVF